ncbi:T9SS sorting signal type C domain-containing protein [Flavobacterium sp. 123]|uniref:Ig-like domain-containing protein n=1 Tax=Flavobacterium sp. 123 TaxID=2135627 RepID=UPI000EB2C781|nr:T9SS sorting signal type C domain-containing protein [Flavobacterium sp. 123]RKS99570.1 hypothetical protein C8C88_1357 [Flavobacterium sp. 123]
MKIFLPKSTIFAVLFLLFAQAVAYSQTLGDYRSNSTNGNWTTLSSWQYYNGTSWVTPSGTSPQGYPGQFTGTSSVLIKFGDVITVGTADLTTMQMGALTISGTLILDGGSGGGTFVLNTPRLIITEGLSPLAHIVFTNKVTLVLPANVSIQAGAGALPTPGNGLCNNNIEIQIGGKVLAYCTGTGSPAAEYTFTDIINNGGYNIVKASVLLTSDCKSSSFTLTGSATPTTGATYNWYSVPSGGAPIATGSTYTSSITATTTFYVEASYASPTSYITPRTSVVVTISPTLSPTWSGSAWSNGIPAINKAVLINGDYNAATSGNFEACSLTINNGATLTIPDTKFVTIQNDLTVNSGGILDIANQGSLVMINDSGVVTNNGTIKVNKTTTAYEKFDYTYWSSPFQSISIPAIFSGWRTDYAFDFHPENFIDSNADGFDDDQNDWANISSMSNPGKGFIVRMPDAGPFTGTSVVFTGNALNNGVVSPSILLTTDSDNANDWNLVGNPYPSAISADSFITQNSASISGTLYFWTHKQDISISNPGPGMYNYTQDDYAMYNLSGGVGTGTGNIEGGVAQVDTKPLGYIASGQGFFVEANVAGNLKFNNSMRSGATITNANTQFYKVATSKEKSTVKNRLWLNMENTDGMFSQQLVGYFAAATNAYDSGYDGLVSDAGNYISFYSFINEDIYKIQGRAAFNKEDQVRLGYFSSVSGTFNINIDSKEGVFNTDETPVYLEDKLLHIIHDLKKGAYSFSTQMGSFDDRFVLRYTNKENEISDKSENEITVYKDKNELVIDSKLQNISRVTVFDLYGKKLFDKELSNSKELHISNGILKNQVLVLNIKLANGQLVSKKVI